VIGVALCAFGKPISVAIGTSLIAAGIVGWVVFTYVFASNRISESLQIVSDFGIVKAFEGRQVTIRPEYDRLLNNASSHIDVLGFGLNALRQDYLPQFALWKQKANVRVLIIDPEFPNADLAYALQRDFEEGDPHGTISQQVKQFATDTREIRNSAGDHTFEVRLYKCLPSVNIFRVDNKMFWGPYLIKQPSRNSPTFLLRQAILFDRLLEHFERIWKDDSLSRPIPNNW
jgi:hypothetical protein